MKKRKRPKLVVNNKIPMELSEDFAYEEIMAIADKIDIYKRYPEINALHKRAHDCKDMAMQMALVSLEIHYAYWRDIIAEDKRNELAVVK
jgi:hypothetical protein